MICSTEQKEPHFNTDHTSLKMAKGSKNHSTKHGRGGHHKSLNKIRWNYPDGPRGTEEVAMEVDA